MTFSAGCWIVGLMVELVGRVCGLGLGFRPWLLVFLSSHGDSLDIFFSIWGWDIHIFHFFCLISFLFRDHSLAFLLLLFFPFLRDIHFLLVAVHRLWWKTVTLPSLY